MGLDPGMDHMSAMKMMDDAKRRGATITSFASWCGGLPSPEAANNPLRYKFSWSPRGVLSAAQNSARFLREGELVEVRGEELLASAESVDFMQAFAFEALPNRDALKYAKLYSIPDASSVYRGTLRYAGFSAIMKEIRDMGLLDPKPVELAGNLKYPATWAELMQSPAINSGVKISAQTNNCLQWLGVWSDANLERKRGWAGKKK
jgi:saccharopine dehydrogenase-like NADP-dependent oxidoreductase